MKGLFNRSINNKEKIVIFYKDNENKVTQQLVRVLKMNENHILAYCYINHDLFTTYIANAITGFIVDWIKSGIKYSPNYMAEQLMEIVMLSSNQLLGEEERRDVQ